MNNLKGLLCDHGFLSATRLALVASAINSWLIAALLSRDIRKLSQRSLVARFLVRLCAVQVSSRLPPGVATGLQG